MTFKKFPWIILLAFSLYWLVADFTYQFKHQNATDIQRLIHFVDVIKFK